MNAAAAPDQRRNESYGPMAAIDRVVLTLHRTGFFQSLAFHVVLLLILAVTVIAPQRPATAVRLAIAFDGGDDPVDVEDVAILAEPPPDLAAPALLAAVDAIPAEAWESLPIKPEPSLEAAIADTAEQVVGLDAAQMLAEVATPIRMAGFTASAAGRSGDGLGLGDGRGFSGELGRRLKAAGARTGDVQVSIAWDNFNDIDLHVRVDAIDPWRGTSLINFGNPRGACGGWLDVDQNIVPTTPAAVENVFWALGTAPYGRYTVYVHQFRNWGGPNPTKVHVAVLVDGQESHHTAVVHAGRPPVAVTTFVRRPGGKTGSFPDDFADSLAPSATP